MKKNIEIVKTNKENYKNPIYKKPIYKKIKINPLDDSVEFYNPLIKVFKFEELGKEKNLQFNTNRIII